MQTEVQQEVKIAGRVIKFDSVRGMGFIMTADREIFFMHASDLLDRKSFPVKDGHCRFTPVHIGIKGKHPRAIRIEVL